MPVLWLSTNAVQLTVLTGDDAQLISDRSCGPAVLWASTNAVQLTVPTGDDSQLMSGASGGWPVLWLSTNAVQLTVPIGSDGQLSPVPPAAGPSYGSVQMQYSSSSP